MLCILPKRIRANYRIINRTISYDIISHDAPGEIGAAGDWDGPLGGGRRVRACYVDLCVVVDLVCMANLRLQPL